MPKQETRKENLLRRLEENREFFMATRKMYYASFMEELIEYIENLPETLEESENHFIEASKKLGW